MTGPKRMRPESAEADSELAISYVVEPERRMSGLSVESAGFAVATGRRSARGNWHSRLRIGIMGGTFDPIHNGHLVAASEVSWVYDLDEVIFVPTGRPVFKLDKNVTNAEDRYLMQSEIHRITRGHRPSGSHLHHRYVARHPCAISRRGTLLHHRSRRGRGNHAMERRRQNVGSGPLRGRDPPRILIARRGETAGRQGRYVGNTGAGDFFDRCTSTRGTRGTCLVSRTGRRGAIYWQARTVPVNFR